VDQLSASTTTDQRPSLTWGVASRPLPGETESGDTYVVAELPESILLAVVDGLGHGSEAADAAALAAATIRSCAEQPLGAIVHRCHAALLGSRGVVLTVVRIDLDGTLSWLGVGNAAGLVWRWRGGGFVIRSLAPLAQGVVGSNLPTLHEKRLRMLEDDVLVLGSDGIDEIELWSSCLLAAPTDAADALLGERARADDDALALVARYTGG
jgi:phosphoserine phosphatase RsbX